MLSLHDLESLRRSNAMAPLSPSSVSELIEACTKMARERAAIKAIVSELPASFGDVRTALNRLQRDRHRRLIPSIGRERPAG